MSFLPGTGRRSRTLPLLLPIVAAFWLGLPRAPLAAQEGGAGSAERAANYALSAPSEERASFDEAQIRELLERTRRLKRILEEDPRILYYTGIGPEISISAANPGYPWVAVRVRNDSAAQIATPANYREADRAYFNYAVRKMRNIREAPPAADCETVVGREVDLVSVFVDGWIVTRLLFGGPAFPPLDALIFARRAGHLPAMLVALEDSELRGCVEWWKERHPDAVPAFQRWYDEEYLGDVEGPIPGR